ncbi:TRP-domain-containing protein [Lophiostoma macrostomum CBS 122681]|uniref:TRP-domain-containing protein n=1 Tax=Lophiostoma macrostomum CBS 122681 TaxID=1314788 RepID=A0A6A6TA78_9PLEO|nr:TRP-domain-containing protein [Lophiostoma macrostomum CBS 122681]
MKLSLACRSPFALLLVLLSFLGFATGADNSQYVTATIDGQQVRVKDSRQPSLYTGNFGDCMGGSSINVTRFDAAYYADNMTVLFHLGGETALVNEAIMMYIGVYAYGESRFELTFNPCSANIYSACPIKAGVPIEANGVIPISQNDIAGIPAIAMTIPDFEGQAILRIFANSTQSQIGCFSATVANGNTFSQPAAVGTVLGIFTIVAVIASFATAIYGDSIPVMRKHYAHSLSVLVVFAVWHHIFYSGALSMNWPSVLVAWWSNFAWAGGMIYSGSMQNSINNFIGSNKGNTSAVGAAGTGTQNSDVGGGYDIHSIYKRDIFSRALNVPGLMKRHKFNRVARTVEQALAKRELANATDGFQWYGEPVKPGLPLPGNYSGFAGTLAVENIPASNAFMTGFLWYLILLVGVAFCVVAFKFALEGMSKTKMIKPDRLMFFRTHWLGYTALAVLRTLFIGFFMMVFLCLFQFTYLAAPGPVAVACIVFLIMLFGLGGLAGYACSYRIKFGQYVSEPDRVHLEKKKILKFIPWYGVSRASNSPTSEEKAHSGSLRWWRVRAASESEKSIHDDEDFTKKFGWLASRFRRTRWWFFVVWLVYEFIRACFLAGASGHPMTQVFGLLVVEFFAFVGIIILRPFEGQRLNLLVVYVLGFSKVATVALSAAFDHEFNLPRIITTVIGVVIIVIQGILMIITVIAIIVGAISSYMSVMRNREQIHPTKWNPWRERYFKHMDAKVSDAPRAQPVLAEPQEPEVAKGPYFSVNSMKRMPKVEDEDREFVDEINGDPMASQVSIGATPGDSTADIAPSRNRAPSIRSNMSYSSLPYGARVHRTSWSSRDFSEHFEPDRQRARGQSLNGRDRPASRSYPRVNTQVGGSSEYVDRVPSPVSPISSPPPAGADPGHIPSPPPMRSKSRASSMKSNKSRPHLPTLLSANEVPPLPSGYQNYASGSGTHN